MMSLGSMELLSHQVPGSMDGLFILRKSKRHIILRPSYDPWLGVALVLTMSFPILAMVNKRSNDNGSSLEAKEEIDEL